VGTRGLKIGAHDHGIGRLPATPPLRNCVIIDIKWQHAAPHDNQLMIDNDNRNSNTQFE